MKHKPATKQNTEPHKTTDKRATTDQSQRDMQTDNQTDKADQRAMRETHSISYKVRSSSEGNRTHKHADKRLTMKQPHKQTDRKRNKQATTQKPQPQAPRMSKIYMFACVVLYGVRVVFAKTKTPNINL